MPPSMRFGEPHRFKDLNLISADAPFRNSFAIQLVYSDCVFYAIIPVGTG